MTHDNAGACQVCWEQSPLDADGLCPTCGRDVAALDEALDDLVDRIKNEKGDSDE